MVFPLDSFVRVDIPLVFALRTPGSEAAGWTPLLDGYLTYPVAATLLPFGHDLNPRHQPLLLYFSINEYFAEDKPNRCITALTRGCHPVPKVWYGPVVILKYTSPDCLDFSDICRTDRHDIRGYYSRLI